MRNSLNLDDQQKLLKAKMLLDTFEIPKRPIAMSAHQYKKKHGSNCGYAAYKREVQAARKQWDLLYKALQKHEKKKGRFLAEIDLSDDALKQAEIESAELNKSIPEILSLWIEKGRKLS